MGQNCGAVLTFLPVAVGIEIANGDFILVITVSFVWRGYRLSFKHARGCCKALSFEHSSQHIARWATELSAAAINVNQLIAEQGKIV